MRYGPAAARDAARAGAHREAVAHFALVLEHADRFPAAERAELLEQYAVECYTIGAAERAAAAQQQAVELNRQHPDPRVLGASLRWLGRVRRRLRALGVARIPRGPLTETRVNPAGLTGRQVDVLRLLGQGFTNAQIASQLVVSVRTVDSHVAAVLGKLGAASRQEAAVRAAELGLLEPRDR